MVKTVYIIQERYHKEHWSESLHSIYSTRELAEEQLLIVESNCSDPDHRSFAVEAWGVVDEL